MVRTKRTNICMSSLFQVLGHLNTGRGGARKKSWEGQVAFENFLIVFITSVIIRTAARKEGRHIRWKESWE